MTATSSPVRRHAVVLLAFSAVYFPVTAALADRTPLWYDELFTVHLSELADPADLWRALSTGTDASPPLYHLLTRAARVVLGGSELATRLPAIVGFWAMCVSVYAFVARRCRITYAVAAMLLPLATATYPMAYNARAYGLLLGCCGAALLCWQRAADGGRRWPALVGLAVSLAVAFGSHYYAFLAVAPLCAGELVRTATRRRLDVPMWLVMAAGPLALAVVLPLALGAQGGMSAFKFPPGWAAIPDIYRYLLKSARWPLLAVLAAAVVGALVDRARRQPEPPAPEAGKPPAHEWAAVVAFALLPVFGVCLGQWVTGLFTARYAAPAVIGWAVLLAFAADRRFPKHHWVAVLLAVVFAVRFAGGSVREYEHQTQARAGVARAIEQVGGAGAEPVVVADPFAFLQLAHYAPPPVRANLVYLRDEGAARRHNPTDPRDWALGQLQRWADVPVLDYRAFRAARPHFLVYGDTGWLRPALEADGVPVRPRPGGLYEAGSAE